MRRRWSCESFASVSSWKKIHSIQLQGQLDYLPSTSQESHGQRGGCKRSPMATHHCTRRWPKPLFRTQSWIGWRQFAFGLPTQEEGKSFRLQAQRSNPNNSSWCLHSHQNSRLPNRTVTSFIQRVRHEGVQGISRGSAQVTR